MHASNDYDTNQLLRLGKDGANIGDDLESWLDDLQAFAENNETYELSDYLTSTEEDILMQAATILRDTYMFIKTDLTDYE